MTTRARKAVGAVFAFVMLPVAATVPASAATLTVTAAADAFVDKSSPQGKRGSWSTLSVRAARMVTYVRFVVPTLPSGEQVLTSTLEVSATTGSGCSSGVEVLRAAKDTWNESRITWKNQPGSTGGAIASKSWSSAGVQTFDVTAAVAGAGRVSFVLRHPAACGSGSSEAVFSSREGSSPPRLIVQTGVVSAAACSDGVDNDADGRIDHPDDPGCVSSTDTDEADGQTSGSRKLAAAGDIVCSPLSSDYVGNNPDACQHRRTDDLLASADAVAALGDLQYPDGTLADFRTAYDPSWGQYAAKTYPVPGNHEYHVPGADGYFDYWRDEGRPTGVAGTGYYSYDLGAWHVIALNSSEGCSTVPCAEGSAQNNWLENDLASTTKSCILAYWHTPLFSTGAHGNNASVRPLWDDLYAARADVIVNGHEHNYQRWKKLTPSGQTASNGIREFVVGTGGKKLTSLGALTNQMEYANDSRFGVLELTLSSGSYSWRFLTIEGTVLDSGGPVSCN